MFVAKYDDSGNHVWSARFGDASPYQEPYGIATGAGGNFALTGSFRGTVDFGGGPLTAPFMNDDDVFLAKFDCEGPIPVLIQRFEAFARADAVEVRWEVWSDEAIESFRLERAERSAPHPVTIAEGMFDIQTRSYVDTSVEPGKTYDYVLVLRREGGTETRSPVATVTTPAVAASLGQNHPNPFNPSTTIEVSLPERSPLVVGVYDASGALVVRLDRGEKEAGTYQVEWDGRNQQRQLVRSGVYFYRLENMGHVSAKKMVLMK
jgi:hypothetical protein